MRVALDHADRMAIPARREPWRSHAALFAAGGVSIITGGLVAAVTGPTEWVHGSWVAAFLVLVAGAAQIGIGAGQSHLAAATPSVGFTALECVLWNAGCATVVAGTLLASPVTVTTGSTLLVATLVMSAVAVRPSRRQRSALLLLYRAMLAGLLVSIPIGIALAWTRH